MEKINIVTINRIENIMLPISKLLSEQEKNITLNEKHLGGTLDDFLKENKRQIDWPPETKTDEPLEVGSSADQNIDEYKSQFYDMSISSIRAIAHHAQNILSSLDNPDVNTNIVEPWLQARIAITEDYMQSIHAYIMFSNKKNE